VNTNSADRYFLGDLRLNDTIFQALISEALYVTVSSSGHSNGTISGYFRCRPHSGIAVLTADQVIGGSNASGAGLGWAEITVSTIHALPVDILEQDTSIEANSHFNGRVLHNATGTTAVTFHAPANESTAVTSLASGTLSGVYNDAKFTNVTVDADFYSIDTSEAYYQVTATGGDIRGQVYALLSPSRRSIPYQVDTVSGNTINPGAGFGTLRFANQQGAERNPNSFITFEAAAGATNFSYIGVVYFGAATNKKNYELVRALTVELNAKISGTGSWLFEIFDSSSGEFIPAGTLSTADNWTPAYIDNYDFSVSDFANTRNKLILRVSVNSASATSLYLDLFGIRSWTPSAAANQALKSVVKLLNTYPGVFANGTEINSS